MQGARTPTTEQLTAEMAWVNKLARALVKDDAVADNVTQDTWLVATEQQPRRRSAVTALARRIALGDVRD